MAESEETNSDNDSTYEHEDSEDNVKDKMLKYAT